MSRPRFSIVIPTRERPTTLRHALATCLDQEFDDYEILICDNGTSAATRQVVDEAGSSRVRYVRAPRPLAMTDNWELAVSEAQGDFILVIGDDDGLMPHALRELNRLLSESQQPVLRWEAAFYTWPDVDLPGQGDYLRLPLGRGLHMVDALPMMASVISFEAPYVQLPTFYNAAIHRDIIEDLQRRAGRVFRGRYPDVYSGFAVAHLIGQYASVDAPMSIAGVSGRSTGVANLFRRGKSPLDEDYRRLNADAGIETHRSVPDLPIFPEVPVADAFLLAKDALFPENAELSLDRRRLLMHCLAGSSPSANGEELAAIRASLSDDDELRSWFEATRSVTAITPRPEIKLRPDHLGFDGASLHLDAARFGVGNIREAVDLAERILQFRRTDVICASTTNQRRSLRREAQVEHLQDVQRVDRPWIAAAQPGERERLLSEHPKVSIVTPSFNQARFLEQTIRSVLDQEYPNLEYVIIDGGSTDGSVEIIERYADRLAYWVSEPDRGQTDALNKGFARATGDIVAWVNSDDFFYPGAVAAAVAAFRANPELGLVYGRGNRVAEDGEVISEFECTRPFDIDALVYGIDYILQPTTFMRRQALHEVGPFDPELHYAFDWDLWMRLGKRCPARMIDQVVAAGREYGTAKTFAGGFPRAEEIRKIVASHTGRELTVGSLSYYLQTFHDALQRAPLGDTGQVVQAIDQAISVCYHLIGDNVLGQDISTQSRRREIPAYKDGWVGLALRLGRVVPDTDSYLCLRGVHHPKVAAISGPLIVRASLNDRPLGIGVVTGPGPFTVAWRLPHATMPVNDADDRDAGRERAAADIVLSAPSVPAAQLGSPRDPRLLSYLFHELTIEAAPPAGAYVSSGHLLEATDEVLRAYRHASLAPAYADGWAGPELRQLVPLPADTTLLCLTGTHDDRIASLRGPLKLWAAINGRPLGAGVVPDPGPFALCWPVPADLVHLSRAGAPGDAECEVLVASNSSIVPSECWASDDGRALAFRYEDLRFRRDPPASALMAS